MSGLKLVSSARLRPAPARIGEALTWILPALLLVGLAALAFVTDSLTSPDRLGPPW